MLKPVARRGAMLVVFWGLSVSAHAQNSPPTPQAAGQAAPLLRVFLDCNRCDSNYLTENVGFIDYVRDRAVADVHVLVTTQSTGSGGTEWTLAFLGQGRFTGQDRTLTFNTNPTATNDEERKEFARIFQIGLVGYAADTSVAPQLSVTWNRPTGQTGQVATTPSKDPWNYWVFRIDGGGNFNGEESSNNRSYRYSFSANRTTEDWKINLSTNANKNTNFFQIDEDESVTSKSENWNINSLIVKSLGPKWSAGSRASMSHSSFSNNARTIRLAPAFEYDIFPYKESTRRIFTIQYNVGIDFYTYDELTIYDKISETVPNQSVRASLALRQPWGEIGASSNISQHLNHTERYRISVNGNADIRLFKGFSFNMFGEYDKNKDQISLRKGEASTEDVLLRVRQLASGYNYFYSFGLSYRFGSIYNNVVNPRFTN